jgi:uncharacterized protein YifN (PemK superfamily)
MKCVSQPVRGLAPNGQATIVTRPTCFVQLVQSMTIKFTPVRGHILMCDYDMALVPPEMDKLRRAVVISPRSYNHPHGKGPGRCIVIPFSATHPGRHLTPADVPFAVGSYKSLSVRTWAICSAIMSVSHERLDRVEIRTGRRRPQFVTEVLSIADLLRIEEGLRHATGTASPPVQVPSPEVESP